jgi:hypothetical protein
MEHLRNALSDAQKLGLIPAGPSEVADRLKTVDPKDIRKLAKMVFGWQTKCVEAMAKPYEAKLADVAGPGAALKAARQRGVIPTDNEADQEQKKYKRLSTMQNVMGSGGDGEFDINKYKLVMAELAEKTEWVDTYTKEWRDRMIADHEDQLASLEAVLDRARRIGLVADVETKQQVDEAVATIKKQIASDRVAIAADRPMVYDYCRKWKRKVREWYMREVTRLIEEQEQGLWNTSSKWGLVDQMNKIVSAIMKKSFNKERSELNDAVTWEELLGLEKKTRTGWNNPNRTFEYWAQARRRLRPIGRKGCLPTPASGAMSLLACAAHTALCVRRTMRGFANTALQPEWKPLASSDEPGPKPPRVLERISVRANCPACMKMCAEKGKEAALLSDGSKRALAVRCTPSHACVPVRTRACPLSLSLRACALQHRTASPSQARTPAQQRARLCDSLCVGRRRGLCELAILCQASPPSAAHTRRLHSMRSTITWATCPKTKSAMRRTCARAAACGVCRVHSVCGAVGARGDGV